LNLIDFHTHAFPDKIAASAMGQLIEGSRGMKTYHAGTLDSLIGAMDRDGVDMSVICNIATKPSQFDSILKWSRQIRSERIEPFPSVHPADVRYLEQLDEIKQNGFKGIKLHPYYQDFNIDDERLMKLYEKLLELDLILVMHTGYDIAFERIDRAGPERIAKVLDRFNGLKFVASHLGAWMQWEKVRDLLMGREIYIEVSFAFDFVEDDKAREILLGHSQDRLLFGTDSPWASAAQTLAWLKKLELSKELEQKIKHKNAQQLLRI